MWSSSYLLYAKQGAKCFICNMSSRPTHPSLGGIFLREHWKPCIPGGLSVLDQLGLLVTGHAFLRTLWDLGYYHSQFTHEGKEGQEAEECVSDCRVANTWGAETCNSVLWTIGARHESLRLKGSICMARFQVAKQRKGSWYKTVVDSKFKDFSYGHWKVMESF